MTTLRTLRARDPHEAALLAAERIASCVARAVAERDRAVLAVSGGETPWAMLEALSGHALPWPQVFVTQVDERVAAAGDPRRNLTRLQRILVEQGPLPAANLLPLPVDALQAATIGSATATAIAGYLDALTPLCGSPPVFDLVQLGLGIDGHTASLLPHDPLLEEQSAELGLSLVYQGLPRLTLTYAPLRRARELLWLVTGEAKRAALRELLEAAGDTPAVRLDRADALLIADAEALPADFSPAA